MPRVSAEILSRIDSAEMTWAFAEVKQSMGDLVARPVHAVMDTLQTKATAFRQGLQETRRRAAQYRTAQDVARLLTADPPIPFSSVQSTLQHRRFSQLTEEGREILLEEFARRELQTQQGDDIEKILAGYFLNKREQRRSAS